MRMRIGNIEFTPTFYPTLAFICILPILLGLGVWQLSRAVEKQTLIDEREIRVEQPAIDLNLDQALGIEDLYRAARIDGQYTQDSQWLLDNRVYQGRVGYQVYSLFRPTGSKQKYLLVNRGWVSAGESRAFLPDVKAPVGMHDIKGRLANPGSVGIELGEPDYGSIAPLIVVQHLRVEALQESKGIALYPYVLVLDEGQAGLLTRDWVSAVELSPAKHLGYAVQWFGLSVALLLIYLGVNTRKIS